MISRLLSYLKIVLLVVEPVGKFLYKKRIVSLELKNSNALKLLSSTPMSTEPEECVDNELYSSPANPSFGCEIYEGTDCTMWSPLLSPSQLDDMYLNCPVTCGIPCR